MKEKHLKQNKDKINPIKSDGRYVRYKRRMVMRINNKYRYKKTFKKITTILS